jgi:hypothetical protein
MEQRLERRTVNKFPSFFVHRAPRYVADAWQYFEVRPAPSPQVKVNRAAKVFERGAVFYPVCASRIGPCFGSPPPAPRRVDVTAVFGILHAAESPDVA